MPTEPVYLQFCSFPGVVGILSLTATTQHGITPSRIILTTTPDYIIGLSQIGDLEIGDGINEPVIFRNCIVDDINGDDSPDGQTINIELLDRRWMWTDLGSIRRRANQIDNRGKLIPWTIMSVQELAVECLEAMGETGYLIDLPTGLDQAAGANVDRWLRLGENFPLSNANPYVSWDHISPAQVLARICDEYGRRVIYQVNADRVIIAQQGDGNPLPEGGSTVIAEGVSQKPVPISVNIAGAPVRIQARFLLEAVGEEWNGAFLPVDALSYAPLFPGSKQVTKITSTPIPPYDGPTGVFIAITWQDLNGINQSFSFLSPDGTPIATTLANIAAAIAASPLGMLVNVSVAGGILSITSKLNTFSFKVFLYPNTTGNEQPFIAQNALGASLGGPDWSYSFPSVGAFANVRATPQLAYFQARELAEKHIFKTYRITAFAPSLVNPATGAPNVLLGNPTADGSGIWPNGGPFILPWFGQITRRQQIILQPTKVEQILPQPRIPGAQDPQNPGAIAGFGAVPPYYNGYSRDTPAVVYGSISKYIGNNVWNPDLFATEGLETKPTDKVFVDIVKIDPVEQTVTFADYLYLYNYNKYQFPRLVLETACLVTDVDTNQVVRWEQSLPLGGPAPERWAIREDIQVGVIGLYNGTYYKPAPNPDGFANPSYKFGTGDIEDANGRGNYYLQGLAIEYQQKESLVRQYPACIDVDLDGYIQQISYSMGPGGITTQIGGNTEFSAHYPDYPTRRRAENFPPDVSAALANKLEFERYVPQFLYPQNKP